MVFDDFSPCHWTWLPYTSLVGIVNVVYRHLNHSVVYNDDSWEGSQISCGLHIAACVTIFMWRLLHGVLQRLSSFTILILVLGSSVLFVGCALKYRAYHLELQFK